MKPSHVTSLLLSLTPLASAFPWPRWLPEIDAMVVRRQTATASAASATQTATDVASSTKNTDAASATDLNTADNTAATSTDGTATGTGTDAGTATGTGTGTADASSGTTKTTSVSVSSGAAAGSAVMKSPVTTLTSAFYKIGDYVTFQWNYTNLEITPTAIDIVASASTSSIQSTWTLTSNMSFATDATFLWDTGAYQTQAIKNQQPLVVEMYTLYIYDAESKVTATAGPGSLTANAALTFGMYTGQPYTALASGWVCATCSGSLSDNDQRALGFALTMVGVTVLSFTWFVTGLW